MARKSDITTSGQASSSGGSGVVTAQMQQQANYTGATRANGNTNSGWDFGNNGVMYSGNAYPLLRNFMTALTVGGGATKVRRPSPLDH
jgi:hypothetical protein